MYTNPAVDDEELVTTLEEVVDDEEDVVIEELVGDEVEEDIEARELVVVDIADEVEEIDVGRVTDEDAVVFPDREIAAPTPAIIITTMTITTATILLMPDLLSFI